MADYTPTICKLIPNFMFYGLVGGNGPGLMQLFDMEERSRLSAEITYQGAVPPTPSAYTLSCRWTNNPAGMGGVSVPPIWTSDPGFTVAANNDVGFSNATVAAATQMVAWEAPARYFQLWMLARSGITQIEVHLTSR